MSDSYTRVSQASYVIIKAELDGIEKYLLQLNKSWGGVYNFIGGKYEEDKDIGSFRQTAIREVEEELQPLRHQIDFTLQEITPGFIKLTGISGRTKEPTLYCFKVYQLFFVKPLYEYENIWLMNEENQWFSKDELVGNARSSKVTSFPVEEILLSLPQGSEALPLSGKN